MTNDKLIEEIAEKWLRERASHGMLSVKDCVIYALTEYAQRSQPNANVICQKDGVRFGQYCWVSHEAITGCEAALIPTKHKQYYEWFLAAIDTAREAIEKETKP